MFPFSEHAPKKFCLNAHAEILELPLFLLQIVYLTDNCLTIIDWVSMMNFLDCFHFLMQI